MSAENENERIARVKAAIVANPESCPSTPEDQDTAFIKNTIHNSPNDDDIIQIAFVFPKTSKRNRGCDKSITTPVKGLVANEIPTPEATTTAAAINWPTNLKYGLALCLSSKNPIPVTTAPPSKRATKR